ncbi:glycosyltransferase [Marinilactibacillus psychrotolerans]|uniref:Glycosyltransferase n=1 Tax=Marinilactibacillus psychrotolerans TaxID=191770 RepID=A0A5R9BXW6_9LACT|nr:glycosyltransferase [Marinilactibacillus psychrotolerans]TLQ05556.1 glycosyltransferase [Marinilactibacillus psychrotolerans]
MRILVLATDYPDDNGNVTLMYIHTRNKYYVENGIDVTVLNFNSKSNYTLDGVKVITLKEYSRKNITYDILVSHAPNIRNHYNFLRKQGKYFKKTVFFFHGHEVLKTSEIYPKPYQYMRSSSSISMLARDLYDSIKLFIWKRYFLKTINKTTFVFVSNWMYDMFLRYTKIDSSLLDDKKYIIYNSIGEQFETNSYDHRKEKEYDFMTIRNNLDGSKYCIDVVTNIALTNPQYKFCVVGKGEFFKHKEKPQNLIWIKKTLSHHEIINFLNKSRYALLPTRTDAQGVMACEMATFGIPLITSNIDVCKEVFDKFDNVQYIDNEDATIDLRQIIKKIDNISNEKNSKYFSENTIGKEIELFKIIQRNK